MTTITVLSRDEIEALAAPEHRYAIITIKSPQGRWAVLPQGARCRGVLRLEFNDVVRDEDGQRMSDEQARDVIAFVTRLYPEIDELIIQCRGGQARSAAIAAALFKIKTDDGSFYFQHEFYRPNRDVYSKLLSAARENLEWHLDDLMVRIEELNERGHVEEATELLNRALDTAKHYGGRFGEAEQA